VGAIVENHHNFAWRETVLDESGREREAIVHRKGATPAGSGVLGIIPGTMGDAGYLVRGRGLAASLNSASHGAGRAMSRRSALERITKTVRDQYLRERGVTLLGGGVDEAPQAYKRIEEVIRAQDDLVEIIGTFTPRIVRMADEPGDV
jgi:tRNA-splicing ligase RtcB (3'-phosphate/5'-hydroxy nucleic acid ligase)